MAARYSGEVSTRQPRPEPDRTALPLLWLLSDERNDARLERTLEALPTRSGFVFRHYHLAPPARSARFRKLRDIAKRHGHVVVVSRGASEWDGADGVYGAPDVSKTRAGLYLAIAHNADELEAAEQDGADGVFLSPVFPTRSHPGEAPLGISGFHILAQHTSLPVIALGGMTPDRAAELDWPRWGAIDGM